MRSLLRHRRLIRDFVARDLRARYVGSTMGFFWSVVFPIINLAVFMFVFRLILKARWGDRQGPAEVALVMLAGIVVWAAFAETLSRSTNTLVDNANLIQKVVFPSEILPVYLAISSLINMLIGMPVVLVCIGWFSMVSTPKTFLVYPTEVVEGEHRREQVRLREQDPAYAVLVELTRGARKRVHVPFELSGTAERGVDYLLQADEVVIPHGDIRVRLMITPLRDALQERDETIVIELTGATGARLARPGELGIHCARRLEITLVDGPPDDSPPPPTAPALVFEPTPERSAPGSLPLDLGPTLIVLPLLLALQGVFTVGLGFLLATLNVFLRDTFHLVGVAITVWMFSTPIFYPPFMVQSAGFGWMLELNPMHWLIESYRAVLLYDNWPSPLLVAKFALAALVTLALGSAFFSAQKSKFPDLL